MSLAIWTDGNYYSRCSVLFYSDLQGISISGLPSQYRVAALSEISCTSAIDRQGNAFNVSGVGGGQKNGAQSITSTIGGQTVSISTSSLKIVAAIRVGATNWAPDSTGGSITLSIGGNNGRWLVVPQKTPIGPDTSGIYEGASVTSSPTLVLSGAYLDADNTNVKHYALVPLVTSPLVTFDPTGGYLSPADRTRYVAVGSALGTLPTPTRTGYAFLGWFTAASGGTQVTASTVITQASDVTYYAHWSKNNVFAMLDATGGTCVPAILEVTVGGTYAALPTPRKSNYIFDGWFTAASGGGQVTNATTVTSTVDHTLYSHWTARSTPAQDGDLIYDDASGRLIYDDRPVEEL